MESPPERESYIYTVSTRSTRKDHRFLGNRQSDFISSQVGENSGSGESPRKEKCDILPRSLKKVKHIDDLQNARDPAAFAGRGHNMPKNNSRPAPLATGPSPSSADPEPSRVYVHQATGNRGTIVSDDI
jgi:hypothetical protein